MQTPQLETERLILRPLALSDVPPIQRHFDNWNIIRHLSTVVPWPYPADGAETFVRMQLDKISAGDEIHLWVLVLKDGDGEAIGNIHLRPRAEGLKRQSRLLAGRAVLAARIDDGSHRSGE